MIVPPNGSGGVQFGFGQSSAVEFLVDVDDPNKGPDSDGNAGSSEGGFNDKLLPHNLSSMEGDANSLTLSLGGIIVWHAFANQLTINGNPTFTSDGHAVQATSNAWLDGGQELGVVESIYREIL